MSHLLRLAALAVAILMPLALPAAERAEPTGPVLLTISGAIADTDASGTARFDLDTLRALPAVTFETTTIWTEGRQTFTGVSLATLLESVGASGTSIRATAINDYSVSIPADDWAAGAAIVAYLNNGEPMSLRGKGPLWIVYPYDTSSAFQTEVIYSRSIWQLDRIEATD